MTNTPRQIFEKEASKYMIFSLDETVMPELLTLLDNALDTQIDAMLDLSNKYVSNCVDGTDRIYIIADPFWDAMLNMKKKRKT